MEDSFNRPSFCASIFYQDPVNALEWLEKAFDFKRSMVVWDKEGRLLHAEMKYGDGYIMLGSGWGDFTVAPLAVGGKTTQAIYVHLQDELDAHYARTRAAGAVILQEPSEQFYGSRTYRARDPEGHIWTFAQEVRLVSREEAEQATGLRIEGRL